MVHGHETTLPITLDQMIDHAAAVVRGVERALVVVDMPFGSYQGNSKLALESAVRIMKESGAHCVKMEGGEFVLESIKRILSAGIPVMGHLGLTPQSIYKFGTYVVRATEEDEAEQLVRDALALQQVGCFALVLEKIPAQLAERVARSADDSGDRNRCRPRRRRAGTGHARHARDQPGILAALSAPVREAARAHARGVQEVHRRRQVRQLPERRGELLMRSAIPYVSLLLALVLAFWPRAVAGQAMKQMPGGYDNHLPRTSRRSWKARADARWLRIRTGWRRCWCSALRCWPLCSAMCRSWC